MCFPWVQAFVLGKGQGQKRTKNFVNTNFVGPEHFLCMNFVCPLEIASRSTILARDWNNVWGDALTLLKALLLECQLKAPNLQHAPWNLMSMPNKIGRSGCRTMEINEGSPASYLARTPCVPVFCTLCLLGLETSERV